MKNIIVLGPSKVGKTALVATLSHAANSRSLHQDDFDVGVLPLNLNTNLLFTQSLELLREGVLPFQGSQDIIDYQIQLNTPAPKQSFFQRLFSKKEETQNIIHFPDAPGGAIFYGDDDEVDDVVMGRFRNKLVRGLSQAHGLIICVDSSVACNGGNQEHLHQVALSFSQWLPNILAEVLQNSPQKTLAIERVCFVLTKADLWAHKNNLGAMSESSVKNKDPFDHAKELLSHIFFVNIRHFFDKNTEFGFCFSSVYGFQQGHVNQQLISEEKSQTVLHQQSWQPFNVIEPFLFTIDSPQASPFITTKTWNELKQ